MRTPRRRLRACADRGLMRPCGKRTRDARSFGELPSFPSEKEHACARDPTIHHRAHLGTIQCCAARARGASSFGLSPLTHPRPGGFQQAGFQVLVFGCAYRRIADDSCSATTLRDRREEWIACGVIETLRQIALEAYDRLRLAFSWLRWLWTAALQKLLVAARRLAKARWIGANRASSAPRRWMGGASP